MAVNTLYIRGVIEKLIKPDKEGQELEYHPLNIYTVRAAIVVCALGYIVAFVLDWMGPSWNPFMVYQDKANAEINKARDKYQKEKDSKEKKNN